jgi:hypothetical protein
MRRQYARRDGRRPVPKWWERNIIEPGKLPLLLMFLAFVVTFVGTRIITRSIRAGRGPFHDNVTRGGTHIHHAVPGIVLLIVGASMAVGLPPDAPWREIAAVLIGIGASLVLDEFALILHLHDDYWTEEGRVSVHAVALASASLGLWIVGLNPLGVDDVGAREMGVRVSGTVILAVTIPAAIVCMLKGKYRLTLLAIFIPPIAVVGAVRLARPGSPWDKHYYDHHPDKRREAKARADGFDARWGRRAQAIGDVIAGRPNTVTRD